MPKKTQVKKYPLMPEKGQKDIFVHALAEYFCRDQAKMSILLQMGKPEAQTWAKLRSFTPLQGYPTVEEAERILNEFLR